MILTVTLNPARDELVLVEDFRLHAKNLSSARHLFAGGKGFNVAKALAVEGLPVTALGFAGKADLPLYASRLESVGIRPALVATARTRTNLKIIDTRTGEETEVNEPGAPLTDDDVSALRVRFLQELGRAEWVVLAGSVPPGVPASLPANLAGRARRRGARCLVDASGACLRAAVEAQPDAVRINRVELGEWAGCTPAADGEVVSAAQALLARGVRCVVVSLGSAGAVMVSAAGAWRATPPARHAANAVGAGDAMSAGLLAAWSRDLAPADALRHAVAVASASVLTLEPGVPEKDAIAPIEERVEVEAL